MRGSDTFRDDGQHKTVRRCDKWASRVTSEDWRRFAVKNVLGVECYLLYVSGRFGTTNIIHLKILGQENASQLIQLFKEHAKKKDGYLSSWMETLPTALQCLAPRLP